METKNEIKQLKEEIKAKAAAISEARKSARADLALARQSDKPEPIREKACSLLIGAKCLGEEQRLQLLRYAWLRGRKYRQVEGRTLADKLGDCWEARMLREALARQLSRFGIGRDDILFWMAEDVLPSEVAARRAEVEARAAAEKALGDATKRAERAKRELDDVTALVARLEGGFALELAKGRLEKAAAEAAAASEALAAARLPAA